MAKDNSKDPAIPRPQQIPLAKIHDLPGVFVGRQPDKSYGGLITSIQAGGVKEPVVLRLREDGEYQLVTGYRRRRASELAKKQDIPALVYEMSIQEAGSSAYPSLSRRAMESTMPNGMRSVQAGETYPVLSARTSTPPSGRALPLRAFWPSFGGRAIR